MTTSLKGKLSIAGLAVAGALFAGSASAGCMSDFPMMQKESWNGSDGVRMMKVGFQDAHPGLDPIVGGWNVVITATGTGGPPAGTVIDAGIQQWHSDGTEFLNSSGQHPLTQNYCMGVWEKVGERRYRVNHYAYNYDTAQNVTGITRIQEEIFLSTTGSQFAGTFQADAYDKQRNHLGGVHAAVQGRRIELGTTAQDFK